MDKNNWAFIGRLARDPKFSKHQTNNNYDRTSAILMVNWPNPNKAEAIPIVAWGARARNLAQHGEKGVEMYVEGYMREGQARLELHVHYMSFNK